MTRNAIRRAFFTAVLLPGRLSKIQRLGMFLAGGRVFGASTGEKKQPETSDERVNKDGRVWPPKTFAKLGHQTGRITLVSPKQDGHMGGLRTPRPE